MIVISCPLIALSLFYLLLYRELPVHRPTCTYISMTSLLTHNVAHSSRYSFEPKTNIQPLKKFLSLAFS